jgi:DNA-directed RNA polymerase subunit K/omega
MLDVTAGKRARQLLDGRSSGTMKATKIIMMLVLAGMAMTAAATGEHMVL